MSSLDPSSTAFKASGHHPSSPSSPSPNPLAQAPSPELVGGASPAVEAAAAAATAASRLSPRSMGLTSGEREPLRLRDARHTDGGLAPDAQSPPAAPGVLPDRNVSAPSLSPAAAAAAEPGDSLTRPVEGRPGAADVAGRVVVVPRCNGLVLLSPPVRRRVLLFAPAVVVVVVASVMAPPRSRSAGALAALP